MYNLEVHGLIFVPQHSKGYFYLGWVNLNPEGIRKINPRPILASVKAVERTVRE
jgi:hypothetical protein